MPARIDDRNGLSPELGWLLYEIIHHFSSSLEIDDVLGKVLSLTVKTIGARYGSIFLLDDDGKVTRSILARENLSPEVLQDTVGTVMEKGFGGWVFRNRKADIIRDTNKDSRWHIFPDDYLDTRSAIAAPLIRKGSILGIITLGHSEPGRFGAEHLDLLQAIAAEAAMAVENASHYQRVREEAALMKRLDKLKNEFVAQVAHDLKSPLGVIYGYAGILRDLSGLSEENRQIVQEIIRSVDHMKKLISTVLDINRIEMGIESEFEDTDLCLIVREAIIGSCRSAEQKGVAMIPPAGDPVYVRGAPVRLAQAVRNLADNAMKFTPAGGVVTVSVTPREDHVEVSVTDTGPGIPEDLHPNLFQKFCRLKQKETRRDEGHGLGLAIVKSIIDAHKGNVRIQSAPGQGSTFSFSIPLSRK